MRISVLAASALCIALLTGTGQAQVPATSSSALPLTPGFMPAYEIARTVRRAGFDPLAPPLREGPIYVVRATDFRGILMRVVVDARSGAIRDASRIVPGPGSYGSVAAMPPYEPLPSEGPPPYGPPLGYGADAPLGASLDDGEMMPPRLPAAHPLTHANVTVLPPLPRPRPPELAARRPDDVKPAAEAKSEAKSQAKSEPNADVTGSAATPPAAASSAAASSSPASPSSAPQVSAPPTTAAAKPGKSLQTPPIND